MKSTASTGHQLEFQKRRQLFVCAHNVTLTIVAVCVGNPDCSALGING